MRDGSDVFILPSMARIRNGHAPLQDIVNDLNLARPVVAGGTGATTAAGARTNLGLEIGTDVQAWDADLDAIAALVSAADKLAYATGAQTWALTGLTAFGRSLIDDADATAGRATLGLGTIATQNANNVSITGGSIAGITDLAVADGGTGASTAAGARENLGLDFQGAYITKTVDQSIDHNTITGLTWGTELYDTESAFASDTFTVPAGWSYADIDCTVFWGANTTGRRDIYILLDSTIIQYGRTDATVSNVIHSASVRGYPVTAGDTITIQVYQDSGGALNARGTTPTQLSIVKAG